MRSNKKMICENVMKKISPVVKKTLLKESFNGFDFIYPSVYKWISEQPYEDMPIDASEVRDYLEAKDPGYRMMTVRGQKITQDLINSYFNDNVPWVNQNFMTILSGNNKLTLLSYAYNSKIPVIVYYTEYNFSKTFTENIREFYEGAASFLMDFEEQSIFDNCCNKAIKEAIDNNKTIAYIYKNNG